MHSSSALVKVSGFPLAESLSRALKNRFVITSDLSVPISERLRRASIVDLGSFEVRAEIMLGIENRISHGIFRRYEAGYDMGIHEFLSKLFTQERASARRRRVASVHDLIGYCPLDAERAKAGRCFTFGRDEFGTFGGDDMPYASVLSWSGKLSSFVLDSEPLYRMRLQKGDAALIWA